MHTFCSIHACIHTEEYFLHPINLFFLNSLVINYNLLLNIIFTCIYDFISCLVLMYIYTVINFFEVIVRP